MKQHMTTLEMQFMFVGDWLELYLIGDKSEKIKYVNFTFNCAISSKSIAFTLNGVCRSDSSSLE